MKNSLLSFLFLILAIPVLAQTDAATANITAQVQTTINVTTERSLDIGTVLPGEVVTINPDDINSGQFNIGSSNNNTRYSYNITASDVVNTVTGTTLPFTLIVRGSAVLNDTADLFVIDGGIMYSTGPSQGPTFGPRLRSIYVGATTTPAVDQDGGTYTGTITVTVTVL